MLIDIITGSRTDILRMASILDAIQQEQRKGTMLGYRFIYTGSDIDINLDRELFTQLGISRPNIYLEAAKDTTASRFTSAMVRYERIINNNKPDFVLATGKTPEVAACCYIAKTNGSIRIGSLNAGTRTNQPNHTDEINRTIIDTFADYHFTSSHTANENLRQECIGEGQLFFIGNTFADTVLKTKSLFKEPACWNELGLNKKQYAIVIINKYVQTNSSYLKELLYDLIKTDSTIRVVVIGNTEPEQNIETSDIQAQNLHFIKRLGFTGLGYLLAHAKMVISDSTTIQDQCTLLRTPCFTTLPFTESPETLESGYNNLLNTEVLNNITKHLNVSGTIPYLWDGKAAERFIAVIKKVYRTD